MENIKIIIEGIINECLNVPMITEDIINAKVLDIYKLFNELNETEVKKEDIMKYIFNRSLTLGLNFNNEKSLMLSMLKFLINKGIHLPMITSNDNYLDIIDNHFFVDIFVNLYENKNTSNNIFGMPLDISLNDKNSKGDTPLFITIKRNPYCMESILKLGPDPNLSDDNGDTPIIYISKNYFCKAMHFKTLLSMELMLILLI